MTQSERRLGSVNELTPERLAELRRIAAETTPGTREGTRMPDAPKRCPFCNSGDRREETWRDRPAYSFSCGTVFYANGEVALRYFSCYAWEKERKERAIREQLAVARAEAERWRKKYEALRAGVERVADDLHMAADEAHDNWRITADFNEQGRSIGLEEAEQIVRRLLTEAGGDDQ